MAGVSLARMQNIKEAAGPGVCDGVLLRLFRGRFWRRAGETLHHPQGVGMPLQHMPPVGARDGRRLREAGSLGADIPPNRVELSLHHCMHGHPIQRKSRKISRLREENQTYQQTETKIRRGDDLTVKDMTSPHHGPTT